MEMKTILLLSCLVALLVGDSGATQQIFIKNMVGVIVGIDVVPENRIAEVKAKVEEKNGIAVDRQRLIFKGDILEDDKTIADYGIDAGMTVHLAPRLRAKYLRILIKYWDGRSFPLEIEPGQTIANLKKTIREIEHIPEANQILTLNSIKLSDDSASVYKSGIREASEVNLLVFGPDGSTQVCIQYEDNRKLLVFAEGGDTIETLKRKIDEVLPAHGCRRELQLENRTLTDSSSVAENKIQHDTLLQMITYPPSAPIWITVAAPDGSSHEIASNSADPVSSLKERVEHLIGVAKKDQILKFGRYVLDDIKTLAEYNIHDSAHLSVAINKSDGSTSEAMTHQSTRLIRVTVTGLDGWSFEVSIDLGDTVSTLKKKITQLMYVPEKSQDLMFGGDILDETKTLAECHIHDSAHLSLIVHKSNEYVGPFMQVLVIHGEGGKFSIDIHPEDRISDLKRTIDLIMPPTDERRELFLNNKQLDNNMRAFDCGIQPWSSLHLITFSDSVPLMVAINSLDGQVFFADVNSGDLIVNLKRKIREEKHIPEDRQRLIYNDAELSESRTFNDYKIKQNFTVLLETRVLH